MLYKKELEKVELFIKFLNNKGLIIKEDIINEFIKLNYTQDIDKIKFNQEFLWGGVKYIKRIYDCHNGNFGCDYCCFNPNSNACPKNSKGELCCDDSYFVMLIEIGGACIMFGVIGIILIPLFLFNTKLADKYYLLLFDS